MWWGVFLFEASAWEYGGGMSECVERCEGRFLRVR